MTATIRRDVTRAQLGSVTVVIADLWGTRAEITGHPTAVAAVRAVLVNDHAPRVGWLATHRRTDPREHITLTLTGPGWAVLDQVHTVQRTLVATAAGGWKHQTHTTGRVRVELTCRPGQRVDFGRAGGAR